MISYGLVVSGLVRLCTWILDYSQQTSRRKITITIQNPDSCFVGHIEEHMAEFTGCVPGSSQQSSRILIMNISVQNPDSGLIGLTDEYMAEFTGCVPGSLIIQANLQETNDEYLCLEPRQRSCWTNRGVYGRVYRLCTWILPAILQDTNNEYFCLEPRQRSCWTDRGVYGRVYRVCTWILYPPSKPPGD